MIVFIVHVISQQRFEIVCSSYDIVLCQAPLEPRGTKFINVNETTTWYVGSRFTYFCEDGFQLLNSKGSYQGKQAVSVCTASGSWRFDSHCQGMYNL